MHRRLRPRWPRSSDARCQGDSSRPAALSLEPINRPRLYRIDHNAKFSWWWPTIWRISPIRAPPLVRHMARPAVPERGHNYAAPRRFPNPVPGFGHSVTVPRAVRPADRPAKPTLRFCFLRSCHCTSRTKPRPLLIDSFVSGFRAKRARTLRKRRESWDSGPADSLLVFEDHSLNDCSAGSPAHHGVRAFAGAISYPVTGIANRNSRRPPHSL
jgi:hypothetical protein